ncbi:hypothetical protein VA249_29760 [Vibrio alfacsensis]|uniref:ATPase n=1 Tax=Vibrio alfacsensis TaxID=1074311 RepID=UPI001BEDB5DC|nr:ATPase [Vibrio alfacsensis]BBM66330.1 hypothetical protein VA249_29760 [Vibrio alfacsensis]
MARLFDVVQELSGQSSSISVPRPYIRFCRGNHTHAAVLSQLVFWSSTKRSGQWFYKAHQELANELELTIDQVRHAIKQLKKRLGDLLKSRIKKANGIPTCHYLLDGDRLIDLLFPAAQSNPQIETAPEQVVQPMCEDNFPNQTSENGNGKSISISTDAQAQTQAEAEQLDPMSEVVFELPLKGKAKVHGITLGDLSEWKSLYPAVDVTQELRKMRGWCQANPTRQKTKQGIGRFIHSWLCREQDKGYAPVAQAKPVQLDEQSDLKRKIRLLEMDVDSENTTLMNFKQRGYSPDAIRSAENRINKMMEERQSLLEQLKEH